MAAIGTENVKILKELIRLSNDLLDRGDLPSNAAWAAVDRLTTILPDYMLDGMSAREAVDKVRETAECLRKIALDLRIILAATK